MDAFQNLVNSVCKPLIVYNIFLLALILFNITQGDFSAMLKNTIFLVIGGALIYALCSLGFDIVAWVLLSMPVFFVISLLALLVITQIIKTDVRYDANGNRILITGSTLMKWFGIKDQETIDRENGLERDYSDDVNGDSTPYVSPECVAIAKATSSAQAQAKSCSSCNSCN
jgi:hypothetical protein